MDLLVRKISEPFFHIQQQITAHAQNILLALLTLLAGYVFYKLTVAIFRRILLRSRVKEAFAGVLINNLYGILVFAVTVTVAAGQLGLNIVAPLAGIGIAGIALGFAAQDSLSNIIAGFLIFFDKPFKVRDYVTIGDNYGRVELITMRSTRIRTQDNKYVVIPNQKIINEVLIDHSTNGDTRLLVPVTITYESSIEAAREAILKKIADVPGVLKKPAPDVVVDKLGDSGINLIVRFWIPSAAEERRFHFLMTEVTFNALSEAKIHFAYPHIELVKG